MALNLTIMGCTHTHKRTHAHTHTHTRTQGITSVEAVPGKDISNFDTQHVFGEFVLRRDGIKASVRYAGDSIDRSWDDGECDTTHVSHRCALETASAPPSPSFTLLHLPAPSSPLLPTKYARTLGIGWR